MRSGLEEGGHGGAALKSGQPWVTAAESSHLGGRMLLGDKPGEDKQRLFYSPLYSRRGLFTTITALLSQPGLWFLARQ